MKLNVERVSGTGVFSDGKWHNVSKFANPVPSLTGVQSGMTIEVEMNSKGWITKVSIPEAVESDAAQAFSTPKSSPQVQGQAKKPWTPYKQDPGVRNEIARGTSVKAVLSSPLLYAIYKNDLAKKDAGVKVEKMIRQFTAFILTGSFDEKGSPSDLTHDKKVLVASSNGRSVTDETGFPVI